MVTEMIQALNPDPRGVYLDGTLGAGGYSEAILKQSGPDGKVVALDLDEDAAENCRSRLADYGPRFTALHAGYQDAVEVLRTLGIECVDGAVLDLGLSFDQLENPEKGFSFARNGPLDMRFNYSSGEPLSELLKSVTAKKLEEILATYGEERYAKKLARGIINAGQRGAINSTGELAGLVQKLIPGPRGRIHPATRTFQALRIWVNHELENLDKGLEDIPNLLKPGASFVVVSYHSLEDRAVKNAFRDKAKTGKWSLATKKPLIASQEEIRDNPKSRSAKMRVLESV